MSSFNTTYSLTDMVTVANTISGGYLMYSFAFATWITLFLITMAYGKWRAMTYSSFLTGVVLLVLNVAGLIPWYLIVLDGLGFLVGLFMMIQSKEGAGG